MSDRGLTIVPTFAAVPSLLPRRRPGVGGVGRLAGGLAPRLPIRPLTRWLGPCCGAVRGPCAPRGAPDAVRVTPRPRVMRSLDPVARAVSEPLTRCARRLSEVTGFLAVVRPRRL